MSETPSPDPSTGFERPRIASALQRARANLVVRPPANAQEILHGVVMPVLHAFGVDVFDLERFRATGDLHSDRAEYSLHLPGRAVHFLILSADAPLPGDSSVAEVISNGRTWRIGSSADAEIELFDDELPPALDHLLNGAVPNGDDSVPHELNEGHDTGEKPPSRSRPRREFVPAGPFERITIAEVRGYAETVRNMRGKLQVWFDEEQVDVTSRAAFYYVLAELALRHGREDAIPGEDLILPPDSPPSDRRTRPLARPGSHLLVDLEPADLEERTLGLLEALGLTRNFTATQRGRPYPSPIE